MYCDEQLQVLLFAVFVVRGKPYSARHVGSVLFPDGRHGGCTCAARAFKPVLAFLWTVVSGVDESWRCFLEPLSSLLSFPANPLAQQLLGRLAGPGRQ